MKNLLIAAMLLVSASAMASPNTIIQSSNGLIGFNGAGGVNNEYLILDFEGTADEVGMSTVSGVSRFNLGNIGLHFPSGAMKNDIPTLTGGQSFTNFEVILSNPDHTGANNFFYGFKVEDMILDANAFGTFMYVGQGWNIGLHFVENLPILFGDPLNSATPGTMLYHDGTVLSVDKGLKIYGDLQMNWTAIRDVEVLGIRHDDLTPGACAVPDEWVIDNGGATEELCVCNSVWLCTPLRAGPGN